MRSTPDYCFRRKLKIPLNEVVDKLSNALFREGFDVLQETAGDSSKKVKISAYFKDFKKGKSKRYAKWPADKEEQIAKSTPCTIIVEVMPSGAVEVAAFDPIKAMNASKNQKLYRYAGELREKLMAIIHRL